MTVIRRNQTSIAKLALENLASALAARRAAMVCSPAQGILALGEVEWSKVLSYRDNVAKWPEKIVIDSASEWCRASENIQYLGYLLGYTDEQLDMLFEAAMKIAL